MNFQHPEWLLLGLPLLLIWWLYLWQVPSSRWLRFAIVLLVVFALAVPLWWTGGTSELRMTLLLDRSLSVRGEAVTKGQAFAQLLAEKYPTQSIDVLGFGRGADVLARPGETLDAVASSAFQDESDLAAGLRLAAGLSPAGGSHELLIVSDGLYTGPDPLLEIPTLRKQQVRVHYLALTSEPHNDVAITRLLNPSRSAVNQPFTIAAEIDSPREQPAQIALKDRKGNTLAQSEVQLKTGINRFSWTWLATQTGIHEYNLHLNVPDDSVPENNQARTAIDIIGPPKVLVLNRDGHPTALSRALASAGVAVETQNGDLPISSAVLKHYVAVVLENMPLDKLNDNADAAITHYIRHLGGGLLITGGRSSYAMGGYYRSYIEDILPVTLDRQEELRRSKLAMAIVLDRSGSMAVNVGGGASKMDLANRGAAEAIALLSPQDEITVFAVDSQAHTVLPLQTVGDTGMRQQLTNQILSIESMGGGIYVYEGLTTAIDELLKSDAATRHIVLFSDAADSEQPGDYQTLIQQWRKAGGSLSVIGLGTQTDQDAALLEDLALIGGGRVYFTANARNLPRVFTQDVMQVARESFIEQTTAVLATRGLIGLKFAITDIPTVGGYNLSYLAPSAELMLQSDDDNQAPLAAGWQRGQGKVMAVTFEADGEFTGQFGTWRNYKRFFRNALEWLKRPEQSAGFVADLTIAGSEATVRLEIEPGTRLSSPPVAFIIPPGEEPPLNVPLHWEGPTRLAGNFHINSNGIYHGAINIQNLKPLLLPPRVLPYSPEFAPRRNRPDGSHVLQQLAESTGGGVFTHIDQLTANPATARNIPFAKEEWGGLNAQTMVPWLLTAALLLILFEIGHRRGLWYKPLSRVAVLGQHTTIKIIGLTAKIRKKRFPEQHRTIAATTTDRTKTEETQPPPIEESIFKQAKKRAKR